MRVVETDNFDSDYPAEQFACPYILTEKKARELAALFNFWWSDDTYAPRYWKVVEDNYQLQPGFEP